MYPSSYLWIESKRYLFVDEEAIGGGREGERERNRAPWLIALLSLLALWRYIALHNFVYRDQTTHIRWQGYPVIWTVLEKLSSYPLFHWSLSTRPLLMLLAASWLICSPFEWFKIAPLWMTSSRFYKGVFHYYSSQCTVSFQFDVSWKLLRWFLTEVWC